MERDIYQSLKEWKQSARRKPLILYGARQTGKTYSLKQFGKSCYEKVVYLNFEKDAKLAGYFTDSLSPSHILQFLSIHADQKIEPQNTLIIFDEIQECPAALTSLKYFQEEANEYHIAAAGSLLGVKTKRSSGFPVGKVNILHLYPLSFFEFLTATGHQSKREFLESITEFNPIPVPLHEQLILLLKYYLFIGGMPEAVYEFTNTNDFHIVREIQNEILDNYEKDFGKHAPPAQIMKIVNVWKQIPQQLAKENKKFIFSMIRSGARARDYEEAIQWLLDAGLIYKNLNTETVKIPLSAYTKSNIFKLFLLDVGLLGALNRLSAKTIITDNMLFIEYKGSLTENYVAQELIAQGQQLCYWTSQGIAELDFLVESLEHIFPLEIKAGMSEKKRSLIVFGEKYKIDTLCRGTLRNLKHDGKIYNYPLYLIGRFPLLQQISK
ncbi:MAG: ATP-binding protein [Gammaproteobacteria bacterium]